MSNLDEKQLAEEKPPVFSSWNNLYAFVLIMHVLIILLFYFITQSYS